MFEKAGERKPLIGHAEKAGVKMLRPVRKGIILRVGRRIALQLLLVLAVALVGVWRFTSLTSSSPHAAPVPGTRPDRGALDKILLDAIRDGDGTQVQRLLQQGANANARDEAGDTALMRAALYADVETMRVLVESAADIQARGQDGTAPLLRTTHDQDKIRLLLDR